MAFLRRIGLFVLTNILVVLLFTTLAKVLGIDARYLEPNGINLTSLALFSVVFGFTGSFISLFMSKVMAKSTFKIKPIIQPKNELERLVFQTVQDIATKNSIKMPEVGIYDSPEPNAFATGASKNGALVAVSTGLISSMTKEEIQGVLGHEMAHVLNGDMVTMTLLQGVMNTFVIFLARVVGSALGGRDGGGSVTEGTVIFVLQIVFGFLAGIIVAWFSRYREFRADAGSAKFLGSQKMIDALRRLQKVGKIGNLEKSKKFATMAIFGGMKSIFATHPPLEDRIKALQGEI